METKTMSNNQVTPTLPATQCAATTSVSTNQFSTCPLPVSTTIHETSILHFLYFSYKGSKRVRSLPLLATKCSRRRPHVELHNTWFIVGWPCDCCNSRFYKFIYPRLRSQSEVFNSYELQFTRWRHSCVWSCYTHTLWWLTSYRNTTSTTYV